MFFIDPSFLVNSHFDHSRAWIPACSCTAALLHRWRGIGAAGRGYNEVLALEVRNGSIDKVRHKGQQPYTTKSNILKIKMPIP